MWAGQPRQLVEENDVLGIRWQGQQEIGELGECLLPGNGQCGIGQAGRLHRGLEIRQLIGERRTEHAGELEGEVVLQMLAHQKGFSDPPPPINRQEPGLAAGEEAIEVVPLTLASDQWHFIGGQIRFILSDLANNRAKASRSLVLTPGRWFATLRRL